jgi:hypothetical protein
MAGYMQQWGPLMAAPTYAPGPRGPSFAMQLFGVPTCEPCPGAPPALAPSVPNQPNLPP